MRKLDRLIREAKESIVWRGHVPGRFTRHDRGAWYICPCCGSGVSVFPKPNYNECKVMGEAVAVNCPGHQLHMYRHEFERYGKRVWI
jgi:hypothetical protein